LLVLLLGVQVWLHWKMDSMLDLQGTHDIDQQDFRSLHRWYLLASSLQWAGAMGLLAWTLWAWSRGEAAGRNLSQPQLEDRPQK
jgi:hypothetical protein